MAPDSLLYEPQPYFLFSYYGQGINFRDIAFLKWSDIVDGRVFYQRAKTGKCLQFKLRPLKPLLTTTVLRHPTREKPTSSRSSLSRSIYPPYQ